MHRISLYKDFLKFQDFYTQDDLFDPIMAVLGKKKFFLVLKQFNKMFIFLKFILFPCSALI